MTMTTQNYDTDVSFDSPKGQSFELRVGPGPYIARCMPLERAPDGQYGPRLRWHWELYNTIQEDGKTKVIPAQLEVDGKTVYQWTELTSTKFGKNPKTGVVAGSRKRAEALLGREISDDDDPKAIAQEIVGKTAFIYLTTQQGNDGNMYLNMSAIEPYKKGMQAPIQRLDESPEDDGDTDEELPFG